MVDLDLFLESAEELAPQIAEVTLGDGIPLTVQ